jgi:hypothetical protein
LAALVTLVGDAAGTFTINLITGKLLPPFTASVLEHVALCDAAPLQDHDAAVEENPLTV